VQIIDFFPNKAFYEPGEPVSFYTEINAQKSNQCNLSLQIFHLAEVVSSEDHVAEIHPGIQIITPKWQPPPAFPRGYGVELVLSSRDGEIIGKMSTAFDVLQKWTDFPRYGFLTDFFPGRDNHDQTAVSLARYHVNGVQFYDWQYRHDQLLSPEEEYIDPLGRHLSLSVIKNLIHSCHDVNMAAMPYLAVYAASMEFWQEHKEWGLIDEDGNPLLFEDFLGLMDPSPESPWVAHLLGECKNVLENTAFDGLHIDQYGDPKIGFTSSGTEVDIPNAFHSFINRAKQEFPAASVTFNAVGNWPMETLASSLQDFVYIEIWEHTPYFRDIKDIVLNAREKSNKKPVVIALYLPEDRMQNARLADAIIFSLGGTRIEIGEIDRLLTDPYFPKHQAIPKALIQLLRQYYNFVIFYSELIGPNAWHISSDEMDVPEDVWAISRESKGWQCINLINTRGLNDPKWTEVQSNPYTIADFFVKIPFSNKVKEIWWSSPDRGVLSLRKCDWRVENNKISIQVPSLDYWTMIAIEITNGDNENDQSSGT
jgi:dextranase